MVEKAFNIISIGKWNELRNQYYYDKLFHLFIYQDISDIGKNLPFYVKWTAKKVTDISSFGKKIIGAGDDKKNKDLKEISLFVADMFKDA